jgi:hypothetical protein
MNKQEIIKHSQKTLLYHRIREGIHTVVSQQLTRDMTSFPIKNAFSIPMLAQKVIMNDETFPRLGGVHPVGSTSPMEALYRSIQQSEIGIPFWSIAGSRSGHKGQKGYDINRR